ncbi:MAG: universal stress protein [Pseudomonadota bacterium]
MRFLVPTDGSRPATRALQYVLELAARCDVRVQVLLLNVQTPLSSHVAGFISRDVISEYHAEQGGEALAGSLELLRDAGVDFEPLLKTGHHAETICAVADSEAVDGIVMGTRGHGGVAGLLMGSVASQVLAGTSVPLTLIK